MILERGIYVSERPNTVRSVKRYDRDNFHRVMREIVSASASSPPLDPPCRMIIPTPTPTKMPPLTAASNGYSDKSGSIGGNISQTL